MKVSQFFRGEQGKVASGTPDLTKAFALVTIGEVRQTGHDYTLLAKCSMLSRQAAIATGMLSRSAARHAVR